MNMKNKISAGIAITFLFVTVAAFAANFTDDTLQIGKPGSSADKSVVFGASNKKKLSHKPSTQTLDYEGNNLSVGDGLNTSDKTLKLNKGVNSPTIRHNFTSGDLEIENAPVLNQKGNTVSVGDGTNTNKVLKFNKGASSPEIRYNSTTGKLQFTNDTVAYKDIGSGSGGGGGINLLQDVNPDFESGSPPQNWTASGGTFTANSATPLFGLQSGNWDASALNQTLSSTLVTIQRGFIGKKCTADIEYRWPSGVSGDLSFQVVDQVPNILATVPLEPTTGSNTRKAFLAFDCPTTATDQLAARLIANVANPAAIDVDDVFVGVNKSTTNVTQASVWARARWLPNTNCTWVGNGSSELTFWNRMALDNDCNNPTVFGQAQVPGTKVPDLVVASLPKGKYRVEVKGLFVSTVAGSCVATITDGTSDGGDRTPFDNTDASVKNHINGFFEYASSQSNVTFRVLMQGTAGTPTCSWRNFENTQNEHIAEIVLYRYPDQPAEALNLETTGWFVDAILTATSSPNLGNTTTSGSLIADADLVLALNDGSAPAKIACSGAVATGTTCSGNEELGVEFDIPYAGNYLVCSQATAGSGVGGSAGANLSQTFWFQERSLNGATTVRDGKKRQTRAHSYEGSSNSQFSYTNIGMCEIWPFASAGPKRISVSYAQSVTGGAVITTNEVTMDTAIGGRNFSLSVYPLTQNFPAPIFTELQNLLKSVSFSATSSSGQSIPNATETTIIANVEKYDTNNAYNPATGVFTVPQDGKYHCICRIAYASFAPGSSTFYNQIRQNGVVRGEEWFTSASVTNIYTPRVDGHFSFNAGDAITCSTFHNSGASRVLTTAQNLHDFSCSRVGN